MHGMLNLELAKTRSVEVQRDAEAAQVVRSRESRDTPGVHARLGSKYWTDEHARHEQPLRWAGWRARRM